MTTLAEIGNIKGNSNAITRWAKLGPYYAMFPIEFAFRTVEQYSEKGDYIIDPFAGRFSSVFAGAVLGRNSVGIEINPIGWIYGKTKLNPAKKEAVQKRLKQIYDQSFYYKTEAENLSEFFQLCFCPEVLRFLSCARKNLDWRKDNVDATLAAIILVNLHGKIGESLSNQMRQTKATAINYSINWWKTNDYCQPPRYNPLEFINKKIEWRYGKQTPQFKANYAATYGDSTEELKKIQVKSKKENIKFSLLFTSPPYYSVVNYHADQWLRLWFLNESDKSENKYKKRFNSKEDYQKLLDSVFGQCAKIMTKKSTVFVRTDSREFTHNITLQLLKKHFPQHSLEQRESYVDKNQTELFNNKSEKKEIDIILTA
jgi:DNA modification methylase